MVRSYVPFCRHKKMLTGFEFVKEFLFFAKTVELYKNISKPQPQILPVAEVFLLKKRENGEK